MIPLHAYMCHVHVPLQAFTVEVQSHQETIEALKSEGEELKSQGSPDDGKRVDHWVGDLEQRWDELGGATDDRHVCLASNSNTSFCPLGI